MIEVFPCSVKKKHKKKRARARFFRSTRVVWFLSFAEKVLLSLSLFSLGVIFYDRLASVIRSAKRRRRSGRLVFFLS